MTPQDQEFLYDPDNDQCGDCGRAVIASLMDLPIKDVPHFAQISTYTPGSNGFYTLIDDWLAERGLEMLWHVNPVYYAPGTYCYISGPSPNASGVFHACVGQVQNDHTLKLIHDPHPSKKGLLGIDWQASFLVQCKTPVSDLGGSCSSTSMPNRDSA